ncbi:uncharacterized protein CEXT_524801 [Caerostris extrusa]|uniref:Uncharacterized protein n=1 Tax=Caerostris extrusa TaxID=172846 RepID=A0AAV4Y802_CAEEX|nr:uncharacterized protein CEXT_524801 [Caerostris extrusa]
MASSSTRLKLHLLFAFVIVWSCVAYSADGRRVRGPKAGSWRTLTGGLNDSTVVFIGLSAAFISGWVALKASNDEMPISVALAIVSFGSAVFYIGCSAAINFLFSKR